MYEDNCKREMAEELVKAEVRCQMWKSELNRVRTEYRKALDKKMALVDHQNDEFIPAK